MRQDIVRTTITCDGCRQRLWFSEIYVCFLCVKCNKWKNEECGFPTCIHCIERPKYPVDPEDDIV
jgi:hypothetical protein